MIELKNTCYLIARPKIPSRLFRGVQIFEITENDEAPIIYPLSYNSNHGYVNRPWNTKGINLIYLPKKR